MKFPNLEKDFLVKVFNIFFVLFDMCIEYLAYLYSDSDCFLNHAAWGENVGGTVKYVETCFFSNSNFYVLSCLLIHIQSRFFLACTTSSKIAIIRTLLGLA